MNQQKEAFEKSMGRINSYLKFTGLNFIADNNDKSFLVRLRRRWWFIFSWFSFNLDFAGEVAWFFKGAFTGMKFVELTYPAPAISMCLLANVKSYYFLKCEPLVNDLISTLQMMQSTAMKSEDEVELGLSKSVAILTRAIKIQYWINILSLGGFAILPFVIMALTYSETGKIQLIIPYMVLYPFDAYDIRFWPFVYLRQMWSASIVVFMVLGTDCFYYACCTYIKNQFLLLHFDLERIVTGNPDQQDLIKFGEEFTACVTRHKELIRCVGLMELIYSKSTLMNVVSSSMLICLTGFNVTAMESWPLIMPFISFVFLALGQIYLFCYFGDIIMRASIAISDATYNSKWYNTKVCAMKDILVVMTRAQKPCKLTAYGFSVINLNTFTRILSTAWSYFALLNTMNGTEDGVPA